MTGIFDLEYVPSEGEGRLLDLCGVQLEEDYAPRWARVLYWCLPDDTLGDRLDGIDARAIRAASRDSNVAEVLVSIVLSVARDDRPGAVRAYLDSIDAP